MARQFKALVFDFDGVICDSEAGIYEAWRWVYASEGVDLDVERYAATIGGTAATAIAALMSQLDRLVVGLVDWERKLIEKDQRIIEFHKNLRPLPGIPELLDDARKHSIPCCIATSLTNEALSERLRIVGLTEWFSVCCTSEMVRNEKPAPDTYQHAAALVGVEPHECIAFEDSIKGLRSALTAGCRCVAVPTAITRTQDFSGASLVLSNLKGIGISALDKI